MEAPLIPRHLCCEINDALQSARVVNIIGPRQVGKTTLVRDLMDRGRFVTLDDSGVLAAVEVDPHGLLDALAFEAGDGPVIIDEVQRLPAVALAIKRIVDGNRRMGQFLLTGSSNVFTTAHVADSLAGRVQTLRLLPLSAAEIYQGGPARLLDWAGQKPTLAALPPLPQADRQDYLDLLVRGGYPEIRTLADRPRIGRYQDAIDAIVDRDVADVLKIRKTDALRRLIDQVAARTAQEVSTEALCAATGVQRNTLEQYMDVLTSLSLVTRLGSWASGAAKREVKRPKIQFVDTGVAAALRGFDASSFGPDGDPVELGHLLETYVHGELVKSLPFQSQNWRLWHWRNQDGREVNVLAQRGRKLVAIEVKAATTLHANDLKNIRWFTTKGPGQKYNVTGLVLYMGDQALTFGDGLFGLPLSIFWAWPSP